MRTGTTVESKKRKSVVNSPVVETVVDDDDVGHRPKRIRRQIYDNEESDVTSKMTDMTIEEESVDATSKDCKHSDIDDSKVTKKNKSTLMKEEGVEDDAEDDEETYTVVQGKLKGYEVRIVERDVGGDPSMVKALTLKNARGTNMKYKSVQELKFEDLRLNDSYKMIEKVSEDFVAEEEDRALLKHEKETWECPKCGAQVQNEHGFCPEIIVGSDGRGLPCGSAPKMPEGGLIGWGDCFAINQLFTGTWQCKTCTAGNPNDVNACKSCGDPRP